MYILSRNCFHLCLHCRLCRDYLHMCWPFLWRPYNCSLTSYKYEDTSLPAPLIITQNRALQKHTKKTKTEGSSILYLYGNGPYQPMAIPTSQITQHFMTVSVTIHFSKGMPHPPKRSSATHFCCFDITFIVQHLSHKA